MLRRLAPALAAVLLAALALRPGTLPAGAASPSAPRIVHATARPRTVAANGSILFTVTVRGFTLERLMGGKPVSGRGHLQYYLDRIPRSAYHAFRDRSTFLGAIGTREFLFRLKQSAEPIKKGRHTILIALAQNNYLLYHAPIARVIITVR